MPCIWGSHNNSQVFLDVAVLPVGFDPQLLSSGQSPIRIFKALLDTGAQSTCITGSVAKQTGLKPIGKVSVRGVSGIENHNNYLFKIGFPLGVVLSGDGKRLPRGISILEKDIQGVEFNSNADNFAVLLGMDVLSIGSLKVEGNGTFSFSF